MRLQQCRLVSLFVAVQVLVVAGEVATGADGGLEQEFASSLLDSSAIIGLMVGVALLSASSVTEV